MDHFTSTTPTKINLVPALSFPTALFTACGIFILIFGLLFFANSQTQQTAQFDKTQQAAKVAIAAFTDVQKLCEQAALDEAAHYKGATKAQAAEIFNQSSKNSLGTILNFYDQQGNIIVLPTQGQESQNISHRSIRSLLEKNMAKQSGVDFSEYNSAPSITAGAPVEGSFIKAVQVTLPLNQQTLQLLEKKILAQVGLLSLDKAIPQRIATISTAIRNFAEKILPKTDTFSWENLQMATITMENTTYPLAVSPLSNIDNNLRAILFVLAEPSPPDTPFFLFAAIALLTSVAGVVALLFALRHKQSSCWEQAGDSIEALIAGNSDTTLPPLPGSVQKAFQSITTLLSINKHLQWQQVDESQSSLAPQSCALDVASTAYQRFFQSAPNGMFQCEANGKFIQINPRFADMLGYDSATHLLRAISNITELCNPDDTAGLLSSLREQPNERHAIVLHTRNGELAPFWLLTTTVSSELQNIEGFLLDRSLSKRYADIKTELANCHARASSLSLLLAATCQQSQAYFMPPPRREDELHKPLNDLHSDLRGTHEPDPSDNANIEKHELAHDEAPVLADGSIRKHHKLRKGTHSLKSVFDDIYQVAITEAEGQSLVAVPLDLSRVMGRVYRQAEPAMLAQGISLSYYVGEDVDPRVNGSGPLLRHALLRALLSVTAGMEGGCASISVIRDPNVPRAADFSRLVFAASWVSDNPNGLLEQESLTVCRVLNPEEKEVLAEAKGSHAPMPTLDIVDERNVVQFLVEKMHGRVLDISFTHVVRSFQFVVQLGSLIADVNELALLRELGDTQDWATHQNTAESSTVDITPSTTGDFSVSGASLILIDDNATASDTASQNLGIGLSILVIDDNQNNRMLFSMYLSDTAHHIFEARSGQEGIEAFRLKKFDVIFIDTEISMGTGYQVIRIIRALEADAGSVPTPIVVQANHLPPEFKQQCLLSGCTEFLAKPFSKTALLSMLDAIAQLKHSDQ